MRDITRNINLSNIDKEYYNSLDVTELESLINEYNKVASRLRSNNKLLLDRSNLSLKGVKLQDKIRNDIKRLTLLKSLMIVVIESGLIYE